MENKEKEITENAAPDQGPKSVVVSEYVKVKKSDLDELTTKKNDLEKFYCLCVDTFNHLEKNKPKSSFDIAGMMSFAQQNQTRMDDLKAMITEIYTNHYTDTSNEQND
jgi:hypothetical protein